jgi:hypothetical protein
MARPKEFGPARNPILAPEPPDPSRAPIGVPPSGPPLTGPSWSGALWQARLTAGAALGKSPLDVDLVALSNGAAVEPPGAATLAVAAIAALTGARLRRGDEVVAELEPDGSLGPVADPAGGVEAALRRGARRIVLPVGGGSVAGGDGQPIDLVALCRRGGATAWLAADLPAAYRRLASASLPEPDLAADGDLALSDAERAALAAGSRRALERLAANWPRLVEQQDRARLPPPLSSLLAGAERGARRAETWRAAGDPVAAYVRLTQAAALSDAAQQLDQILRLVAGGDLERARGELDAVRPATELVAPGGEAPATVGDHLRVAAQFRLGAAGWAWAEEASAHARTARAALDRLSRTDRSRLSMPGVARDLAGDVAPLLVAGARARLHAELAQDRADLDPSGGAWFKADPDRLRQLAVADAAAAADALAALDRVEPAPPGPSNTDSASSGRPGSPSSGSPSAGSSSSGSPSSGSPSSGQPGSSSSGGPGSPSSGSPSSGQPGAAPSNRLAWPDAIAAARLLSLLDSDGDLARGSGRPRVASERSPLLAAAVARLAYDRAAAALARRRRLGPDVDPWTGLVVSVARPGQLRFALVEAEVAARRQASAARVAIGFIPFGARLAFQAAGAFARGDHTERVAAIELYQAASAECRLAVLLALSEAVAPSSGTVSAGARAGCPPSPSGRRACR